MDAKKIGNLLMKKREQIGMSQEDLAQKLIVSKHKIETWESGKAHLPVVHYEKICDLLHISITELLTGEDISPEKKAGRNRKTAMDHDKIYPRPARSMDNFHFIDGLWWFNNGSTSQCMRIVH